jgi:hypothetical protein
MDVQQGALRYREALLRPASAQADSVALSRAAAWGVSNNLRQSKLRQHILSRNEPYHESGSNYFDEHRREHLVDRLARRIERLGYHVALEPVVTS